MKKNRENYKKRILKESEKAEASKTTLQKFSKERSQRKSFKEKFKIALKRFENHLEDK